MVLKTLFSFILLSHCVLGRLTWNDRQLIEGADQGTGDEWQYCEDECTRICPDCEVHNECKEDEIRCGYGDYKVSPNGFVLHLCAKDEICVSDKCTCKFCKFCSWK